ncbi:hypothetical protein [Vibrio alginolyticus]|uniref:hypothetical protein n=1 Tax=Vibrio alginolyticus TaxID=663 RepID=UPI001EFD0E05|nr:hypothetical protein [Vibrio alginolyticus]MCG9741668.1 hypothetical protein [Vibrio alginolyticus]
MKINQQYLELLLKPLQGGSIPTLNEYFQKLPSLGVEIEDDNKRIKPELDAHLRFLSSQRIISNLDGYSDLKSLGIGLGNGNMTIIGDKRIMLVEKEESPMPQINIGSISSSNGNVQVGNNNAQVANVNIQEIVEKVAASDDAEAKNVLKSLLENKTVASIVGVGLSSLIGLL